MKMRQGPGALGWVSDWISPWITEIYELKLVFCSFAIPADHLKPAGQSCCLGKPPRPKEGFLFWLHILKFDEGINKARLSGPYVPLWCRWCLIKTKWRLGGEDRVWLDPSKMFKSDLKFCTLLKWIYLYNWTFLQITLHVLYELICLHVVF